MPKTDHANTLYKHFLNLWESIGEVEVRAHGSMITIHREETRIAYVTAFGRNFMDIVFPFRRRYDDNLCFRRIQEVPGRKVIYHHLRMQSPDDITAEVKSFMRQAYDGEP